jgi:hypothetical protein
MHVVALHRVVDDPEAGALANRTPAPLELGQEAARSQRGHVPVDPERDVAGMPRRERSSSPVRIARARPGLPPSSGSPAAPARRLRENERELTRSRPHGVESHTRSCQIRSHLELESRDVRGIETRRFGDGGMVSSVSLTSRNFAARLAVVLSIACFSGTS